VAGHGVKAYDQQRRTRAITALTRAPSVGVVASIHSNHGLAIKRVQPHRYVNSRTSRGCTRLMRGRLVFEWIEANDSDHSVLAFMRRDGAGAALLIVCNFTPMPRHGYRVGMSEPGQWREVLTATRAFRRPDLGNGRCADRPQPVGAHGRSHSLALTRLRWVRCCSSRSECGWSLRRCRWPAVSAGVGVRDGGVNFALFSAHAERMNCACSIISGSAGAGAISDRKSRWHLHGFRPAPARSRIWLWRAVRPYAPERGHRFNPNKLLLDPYAR